MFAACRIPEKLWLRTVDNDKPRHWEGEGVEKTLNCYYVCSFNASESRDQLRPKVDQLLSLCRKTTANIGSRRAEEHIYQLDRKGLPFRFWRAVVP